MFRFLLTSRRFGRLSRESVAPCFSFFRPLRPAVRQQQLHLVGALCQHHATAAAGQAERVRGLLLSELQRQIDSASTKVEKAVVAGALQVSQRPPARFIQ